MNGKVINMPMGRKALTAALMPHTRTPVTVVDRWLKETRKDVNADRELNFITNALPDMLKVPVDDPKISPIWLCAGTQSMKTWIGIWLAEMLHRTAEGPQVTLINTTNINTIYDQFQSRFVAVLNSTYRLWQVSDSQPRFQENDLVAVKHHTRDFKKLRKKLEATILFYKNNPQFEMPTFNFIHDEGEESDGGAGGHSKPSYREKELRDILKLLKDAGCKVRVFKLGATLLLDMLQSSAWDDPQYGIYSGMITENQVWKIPYRTDYISLETGKSNGIPLLVAEDATYKVKRKGKTVEKPIYTGNGIVCDLNTFIQKNKNIKNILDFTLRQHEEDDVVQVSTINYGTPTKTHRIVAETILHECALKGIKAVVVDPNDYNMVYCEERDKNVRKQNFSNYDSDAEIVILIQNGDLLKKYADEEKALDIRLEEAAYHFKNAKSVFVIGCNMIAKGVTIQAKCKFVPGVIPELYNVNSPLYGWYCNNDFVMLPEHHKHAGTHKRNLEIDKQAERSSGCRPLIKTHNFVSTKSNIEDIMEYMRIQDSIISEAKLQGILGVDFLYDQTLPLHRSIGVARKNKMLKRGNWTASTGVIDATLPCASNVFQISKKDAMDLAVDPLKQEEWLKRNWPGAEKDYIWHSNPLANLGAKGGGISNGMRQKLMNHNGHNYIVSTYESRGSWHLFVYDQSLASSKYNTSVSHNIVRPNTRHYEDTLKNDPKGPEVIYEIKQEYKCEDNQIHNNAVAM